MSRETERLESQIQQDRQEVKHTLDALQDKFSVDRIIQDLFGASNGGAKNTAEQIWSQLRNHPAPALMTVAGLIWLSASTAKSDGGHSWSDEDRTTLQRYNRLRALEGRFQRFDSETDEAFMSRQYSARASELGIENTQGERFEEFEKKVDEAAKKVNDSAQVFFRGSNRPALRWRRASVMRRRRQRDRFPVPRRAPRSVCRREPPP
jgi:hypothetical protein